MEHPENVLFTPENYSELKDLLSTLKSTQKIFKALIKIAPYPITMWDPDGRLIYANNEAFALLGDLDHVHDYCIWEDVVIKKYKNVIQSKNQVAQAIYLPSLPELVCRLKENTRENFSGIESIICPIRNAKNSIELILIYFIDNSRAIKLRNENQQLRDEYSKLTMAIETVESLIEENENHAKDQILNEIKNNLADFSDKCLEKKVITGTDIKKVEKIINRTCSKYQLNKSGNRFSFTPCEKKICEMLNTGLSGKEIAKSLHVSYSTVHTHINHIRKKINITGTKINLQTYIMNNYE